VTLPTLDRQLWKAVDHRGQFLLILGRYQVSPFALDAETLADDVANA
jgi:hypothetical protein